MNTNFTARGWLLWRAVLIAAVVSAAGCEAPTAEKSEPDKSEVADNTAPENIAKNANLEKPPARETIAPPAPGLKASKTLPALKPVPPESKPSPKTVEKAGPYAADQNTDDAVAKAIRHNGPIFEDWPKPKLAIVFSGRQSGYIEPCGCAGLENQKGGLSRRHTFIKQLRGRGWPVVALDLGGLIRRTGKQAQIKYERTITALTVMDYSVIGFGPDDLRLPGIELLGVITNTDEGSKRFVSANLTIHDASFTSRFRIVEIGGYKLGVTSVLGESERKKFKNDLVEFQPPEEALKEVLPKLKAAGCDRLILLVHAPLKEAIELAKKLPDFDLVVAAGEAETPPARLTQLKDKGTRIVQLGYKGMYVGVVALFDDEKQPLRYQRVPLDARFKDSAEMKKIMVEYQDQLKSLGWKGLGLKPLAHASGRKFVGSETCAECHTTAHAVWEKTPHAHALETLTKLDPPRHHDPECISCHATGWNAQKYFPYTGGFDSLKTTPLLTGNGCENCHGPGARHAAVEQGELEVTEAEQDMLRESQRLTLKQARDSCLACHDLDNSPEFHKPDVTESFRKYWEKVKHKGKD
ncbi:MAG: cytochrome C554 [Planctomycetes bacterium]|nr:cytochrome C554 [Planctomycetota bacterium]